MDKNVTKKIKVMSWIGKPQFGYWKKKKNVFSTSHEADTYIKDFIEMEIDASIKVIDLCKTPISLLREICDYNNISFWWMTGIDCKNQEVMQIEKGDTLHKAIEYFLAFKTAGSTTRQYRNMFKDLIDEKVINPSMTLQEYHERKGCNYTKLSPGPSYNEKLRCMMDSFHRFIAGDNPPRIKKQTFTIEEIDGQLVQVHLPTKKKYRKEKKERLQPEEAEAFILALHYIDPMHAVIAGLLWYYNHVMWRNIATSTDVVEDSCDYKEILTENMEEKAIILMPQICNDPSQAPIIHLEFILKAKIEDCDAENRILRIYSRTTNFDGCFAFHLPEDLMQRVKFLADNTDLFIFRNHFGCPVEPKQIFESFKKASKKAGLTRIITPSCLR